MSAERDMTRIVRSWLRVDEHESADRVLDNVFALLDATPQRPAWWPARRIADMSSFAKFAIAAAAVVVVAVIGINLLPAEGGVGAQPPSGSPSSSPSPTPSPSPSPTEAAFPPQGDLTAGTYSMTRNGIRFSVTVPTSGWMSDQSFFFNKTVGVTPQGASLLFWNTNPIGVFADPCTKKKAPPADPTAADLAAAVSTIPGAKLVSGPVDGTVGGRPAKQVVITVPEDAPCRAGEQEFHLWYAQPEGEARYISALGATMRVWIIDVDGKLIWIDGETYKGAGPEPAQEIQQIIDSIQFE